MYSTYYLPAMYSTYHLPAMYSTYHLPAMYSTYHLPAVYSTYHLPAMYSTYHLPAMYSTYHLPAMYSTYHLPAMYNIPDFETFILESVKWSDHYRLNSSLITNHDPFLDLCNHQIIINISHNRVSSTKSSLQAGTNLTLNIHYLKFNDYF